MIGSPLITIEDAWYGKYKDRRDLGQSHDVALAAVRAEMAVATQKSEMNRKTELFQKLRFE